MRRHFGEPEKAQLQKLYHAPDLTILHLIWAPNMTLMPHDHGMWALIGLYEGREDNIFWRSNKEESGNRVEAAGARTILPGECLPLGQNIVHSVTNPISRFTEAIHIYGGDFFNTPRSEWDPETLTQRAMDPNNLARMFEDANRRLVPARV